MPESPTFYFKFFKLIDTANPMIGSRISMWSEDDASYLVPSEFKDVINQGDFYKIKVTVLIADKFYKRNNIGKKFYFGSPNRIVGYGVLEEIDSQ